MEGKPRMFSVSETALLLGISESYLTNALEHENGLYPRRNHRGERVYSAGDIAILRRMGVGQRPRRLRFEGVTRELGLRAPFGTDPPRGSLEAQLHARVVKRMEQEELEKLSAIREEARRRRAAEWRG